MNSIKRISKWLLLIFVTTSLVFGGLWLLNSPESLAAHSQSRAKLDQANYLVGQMDLEIIDPARSTPALGSFEGLQQRSLSGTIWFPKGDSLEHPLVVYSHGFGGHHKESRHLTEYLAANGYMVAAVDFPLSGMRSLAEVPQLVDVVNQPGDVSAVIDRMLALNDNPSSPLYQRVDADSIGAMGLSLGGLTTALVAFHPDLKDQRIKAATMMAPPLEAFSEQFYASNQSVESLVMSGTLDRVVPELANATDVKVRHPNGWFVSMDKGTHLGFSNLGNPTRWMENPDNLGCAFLGLMLAKLDLPERWDSVIPNTGDVLRDVAVGPPCPELPGQSMNGLKQQWLTRLVVGSFFDMHLRSGPRAEEATEFFTATLGSENPAIHIGSPR